MAAFDPLADRPHQFGCHGRERPIVGPLQPRQYGCVKRLAFLSLMVVVAGNASGQQPRAAQVISPAAQIDSPPSPSKLGLIKRYLRAIGRQQELDSGIFLERYAVPGGPMWAKSMTRPYETLGGGFEKRMEALRAAYSKHRAEYQEAYEQHVNWEFTEAELAEIVSFLEKPVGKHYLDGRWRMDAYVHTGMEDTEAQIVREAIASISR